jgi:hypothetical protein
MVDAGIQCGVLTLVVCLYITSVTNMSTLKDLIDLGTTTMGLTGTELNTFVSEQQAIARDDRAAEREREREHIEREREKAKLEHEKAKLEHEKAQREHELARDQAKQESVCAREDAEREHKRMETQQQLDREKEQHSRETEKLHLEMQLEKERTSCKLTVLTKEQEMFTNGMTNPSATPTVVSTPSSYRGPKLPPFDDVKDDMDAYLLRFERYATAQKWDASFWATHLSALLKGKALEVYARFSPELALDYKVLKKARLKRFELFDVLRF